MIERALITALIAVAIIAALTLAGQATSGAFQRVNCGIDGAPVCVVDK